MNLVPPVLAPEPDPEAVHRPTWGVNRLLEGDCLERLAEVPEQSVHLVLCDLPYGTTQNRWDSVIPLDALWAHYRRILTPKGAVVLTGQGPFTARLILSNEDWFRYKWTWVKSKATQPSSSSHAARHASNELSFVSPLFAAPSSAIRPVWHRRAPTGAAGTSSAIFSQ